MEERTTLRYQPKEETSTEKSVALPFGAALEGAHIRRLEGKSAVITGGGGAIGNVLVTSFLREGSAVAVPVRPGAQAPDLPAGVMVAEADLTSHDDVRRFCGDVLQSHGRIDILVNAAGAYAGGSLTEESTVHEWENMLAVNVTTAYLMCRTVLPGMRGQGFGRIITFAAMPARAPGARRTAYQVAKRGVVTLTESIAAEIRGTGITINAVAPSIIRTEANRAAMPDADVSRWVPCP